MATRQVPRDIVCALPPRHWRSPSGARACRRRHGNTRGRPVGGEGPAAAALRPLTSPTTQTTSRPGEKYDEIPARSGTGRIRDTSNKHQLARRKNGRSAGPARKPMEPPRPPSTRIVRSAMRRLRPAASSCTGSPPQDILQFHLADLGQGTPGPDSRSSRGRHGQHLEPGPARPCLPWPPRRTAALTLGMANDGRGQLPTPWPNAPCWRYHPGFSPHALPVHAWPDRCPSRPATRHWWGPLQLTNQTFSSFLGSKNQHRLTGQGEVGRRDSGPSRHGRGKRPPPHRQNQQDRV